MANELIHIHDSSLTVYAVVANQAGQVYAGTTPETPATANWGTYDIPATESGTTGIYLATMPVIPAGAYWILWYEQIGASPAVTDDILWKELLTWDGTQFIGVTSPDFTVPAVISQSAAEIESALAGTSITLRIASQWSVSITGLGDLASRTRLYFTVKRNRDEADNDAILQIEETDGLKRLNGAAYATAAHGSLVVSDEAVGDLTITLADDATAQLQRDYRLFYDIKGVWASGSHILTEGEFHITPVVTRAIS